VWEKLDEIEQANPGGMIEWPRLPQKID
jgi:hypothetical protein